MTISTTTLNVQQYTGNGSVSAFAVTNFPIIKNSDNTYAIQVFKTTIATGAVTTLVETTDYTVALDSTSPSTGTVTLVAGNLPSTHRITIIPNIPEKQEVDLQNATLIDVTTIEAALDKLTLLIQQQEEKLSRAIIFGEDAVERDVTMTNLTSDQINNLITQLNTLATSDNSVSDFSINALTTSTDVDGSADFVAFHDTSLGTMKKALVNTLIPQDTGDLLDAAYTNISTTNTITVSAANTWYDVPGLTVSTTPDNKSDKILVGGIVNIGSPVGAVVATRIMRSDGKIVSSLIKSPKPIYENSAMTGDQDGSTTNYIFSIPLLAFDQQAGSTSALTYSVQMMSLTSTGTFYLNRTVNDSDAVQCVRTLSQINVMRFKKSANTGDTFTNIDLVYTKADSTSISAADISSSHYGTPALSNQPPLFLEAQNSSAKHLLLGSFYISCTEFPGVNVVGNNTNMDVATSIGSRRSIGQPTYSCCGGSSSSLMTTSFVNRVYTTSGLSQNYYLALDSTSGTHPTAAITLGNYSNYYHGGNFLLGLSMNTSKTGTPWKQIVSTSLTTAGTSNIASGATYDIGLSRSITPTSASSILLLSGSIISTYNSGSDATYGHGIKIQRDGSDILVGTSVGSRSACLMRANPLGGTTTVACNSPIHLMVPATSTTATTFLPLLVNSTSAAKDIYYNRTITDTDASTYPRYTSMFNIIEMLPN